MNAHTNIGLHFNKTTKLYFRDKLVIFFS